MISSPRLTFAGVALWGCLALSAPFTAHGQSVVRSGTDRISIVARGVTLEEFFDEFSKLVPVETLILAPEVKRVSVTVRVPDVHPAVGVRKFLDEAEVDYAISGGDGKPFRIIVGPLGDAKLSAISQREGAEDSPPEDAYVPDDVAGYESQDDSTATSQLPETEEGQQAITGMASPSPSGGMPGPRSAPGTAIPGATPGAGAPGRVAPPSPPPGPGNVTTPPGTGPRTPRPSTPSRVSGGAFIATGSAGLGRHPMNRPVAATGGLLAFGLLLGVLLVRKRYE